ncbi:MAG TPA: PAS domain-containing protein, partial [Mycobacteriales bacterium]|nr:PAS domain-containing protein [Mycobacteriales bacterium]
MNDRPAGAALSRRTLDTLHAVDDAVDSGGVALAHDRLPRLLHEAPAACLLVDLSSGCVVQANTAGRSLAPDVDLPVPAQEWACAAGITDLDGQRFASTASPVERVASHQEVLGEPVKVPDGRVLWTTGFLVPTDGEHTQALVVLFEVAAAGDLDLAVRDRAVVAAGLSFTITDPNREDDPLVFVNPAFERTTGYSYEEAVGRNCRFLQGPGTDPAAVARVRELLERREHGTVTLLNHRKDGTAFWNELSLSPVYDGQGRLTHFVGI